MDTTYTWQGTDASGAPVGAHPTTFPTQADAEAWLAQEWEVLAQEGVTAVTLLAGDEPVYGPMSLSPAD